MTNLTDSLPQSEARAGVGLGLTAIHATVSGSESRAGVGQGLTSIHAPISSQLSTALSTSEFELPAEDPQQSFEESKFCQAHQSPTHYFHACIDTNMVFRKFL